MQNKILLSIIAFVVLFIVIGCSSGEEALNLEGVTGEIVEINDGSFLIQGDGKKVDLKYANDTVFEGKSRNELDIGDQVNTWYKGEALDSSPIQATASKIEYIK
ncbi:DUF3221 domain-containing protein [Alkalibacillus sp. S2W]|uniref:DUF3221 domain-containing protein n=1 Tax=Alkalibacillus sp. S2W TaxID=3386553 RepID=UPI00398CFD82